MNTDVWIPYNFINIENMTIFKIGWIFLFVEGVWMCCLACIAAKVIRQHMFFFT